MVLTALNRKINGVNGVRLTGKIAVLMALNRKENGVNDVQPKNSVVNGVDRKK